MRVRYLLALAIPYAAHAQTAAARDSVITVTSQRVTRTPADRISFYVVIEGVAETATDAVARVQTKIAAVNDAIHRAAPQAKVDRPIAYGVGGTPSQNGFPMPSPTTQTARSVIRVQSDHPDQVATVIAAAVTAGATGGTGVTFELSSPDSVRRARVAETLAEAHSDAQAIAAALQGHLGALVDVTLSGSPVLSFGSTPTLSFDNRFFQPSAAPEVTVSTNMTVRYRLIR
jgi:uncharacterized protein YggE